MYPNLKWFIPDAGISPFCHLCKQILNLAVVCQLSQSLYMTLICLHFRAGVKISVAMKDRRLLGCFLSSYTSSFLSLVSGSLGWSSVIKA